MRVCHCVGYLTNPGGKCCKDLGSPDVQITTIGTATPLPLDEEQIRQIIREELRKAKKA